MNIQSLGRSIDTTSCHIASVPERRPVAGDSSATVTNAGAYAIGRTVIIRTSLAIETITAGRFKTKIPTHGKERKYAQNYSTKTDNIQRKIGDGEKKNARKNKRHKSNIASRQQINIPEKCCSADTLHETSSVAGETKPTAGQLETNRRLRRHR